MTPSNQPFDPLKPIIFSPGPPPLPLAPPPVLAQAALSGNCLVHPHNRSIGRCQRCQQPFCEVCRSKWQKEVLCLACLNQALESRETPPVVANTQARQGKLSLIHAIIGWCLFLGSFLMFFGISDGRGNQDLAILDLVLFLASFIPALLSLGFGLATIRSRGERLVMATWGVALSSAQLGVTFSLVLINITHN